MGKLAPAVSQQGLARQSRSSRGAGQQAVRAAKGFLFGEKVGHYRPLLRRTRGGSGRPRWPHSTGDSRPGEAVDAIGE
jgi:hypothetical protein